MSWLDNQIVSAGDITLQQAIEVWGEEFEEQLKHSLDTEGLSNSALKRDIHFTVTKEKNGFRFALYFPDYGNYIDEGVKGAGGVRRTTSKFRSTNNKGKMWRQNAPQSRFKFTTKRPPLYDENGKGIEPWANKKGLNKFAVQEIVFRQGIKPTHWFSDIVNEDYTKNLIEILEEHGSRQIELDLSRTLTGYGTNT